MKMCVLTLYDGNAKTAIYISHVCSAAFEVVQIYWIFNVEYSDNPWHSSQRSIESAG